MRDESEIADTAASEVSAGGLPVGGDITTTEASKVTETVTSAESTVPTAETAVTADTSPEESAGGSPVGGDTTVSQAAPVTEEITSAPDTAPETKRTAESTAPEKTDGYAVIFNAGNGWENSGVQMATLELKIENNSSSSVSGWKLELDVEGLKSVEGWNGTWTVSGNTLTVTNVDYNGDIPAGGAQYIGCNIGTASSLNIKSAVLNGKSCTLTKGRVDQNQQNQQNNDQNNNNNNNNNGGSAAVDVAALLTRNENAVQGDDWLHTDGSRILDKNGKQVWLTGLNWFGYNTGTNTFDGLWNSRLAPSVKAIADHGFNLIRVPISAELINQWAAGEYPRANYNNAYNEELNSMNSLEIFEYFLKLAEDNGIKVMPDIHSANTDASGHNINLWYTDRVSEDDYYSALEWMAYRYRNNDTIIAYDLKNEPHGKPYEGDNAAIWNDSKAKNNWKNTAEVAAAKILAKNPNVLIMVEGTEIYPKDIKKNGDYKSTDDKDYYFNWWGGNLRGVKDYPVDLGKYQNKLVYSPHDYGPTVYRQPWFEGTFTFESLMKDCWKDNWFYICENGTAPLLIGEWGGFMTEPNLTWMTYMRRLISENHLNHTFWCFNANSGDTGGLVLDDFTTWDDKKYNFVKEVLWQENGKFVGLDHAIKLGENGIDLSKAKGL
ncbi:MAG: cellulase family glycosylhydrolase [Ruminiclostridium sp.]|nr:cellulase family glycosylhydrolase [Ruminiclostridium sp.]